MTKCKYCKKDTNNKIFCSNHCRALYYGRSIREMSKEEKKKFGNVGENHPLYGKTSPFKGRKHSKETLEKMSKKQRKENHPSFNKPHSEIHKKRIGESVKKRWTPEIREQYRNRMLDGLSSYASSFIKNPSKPQVKLFDLVKEMFPSSILNYPVYNLNKSIDIAIPDLKIAVEFDGSYWHQDKEKDLKRQRELESEGWKFVRFTDRIPTIEELSNLIKEKLEIG